MYLFIISNLIIVYAVKTMGMLHQALISPHFFYLGVILIACSGLLSISRKKHFPYSYDLFATGILFAWFSYWNEIFAVTAPMFFHYPLFFIFYTSLLTLYYVNRSDQFDEETKMQLFILYSKSNKHIFSSVLAVLVSLLIHKHYTIFPVTVVLFILCYTLKGCMKHYEQQT